MQCCEYFGGTIVLTAAVTKCLLHLITIHFLSTCQQKDKDKDKDNEKDVYLKHCAHHSQDKKPLILLLKFYTRIV